MTAIDADSTPTRRDVRSGVHLRQRWRRVDRLLTAGVGSAAVAAALYLGVTAPASSPVQPPLPVAAATVPQAVDGFATDPGVGRASFVDHRGGGGHGDGGGR